MQECISQCLSYYYPTYHIYHPTYLIDFKYPSRPEYRLHCKLERNGRVIHEESIFVDYAMISLVSNCAKLTTFCEHCGRDGAHTCGNCKFIKYCGRECQAKDWSTHKHSCRNMTKMGMSNLLTKRFRDIPDFADLNEENDKGALLLRKRSRKMT